MELNYLKIINIQKNLEHKIETLQQQIKVKNQIHLNKLYAEIQETEKKLCVINRIALRNALNLAPITKRIYVSTTLKPGGNPPPWITEILEPEQERGANESFEFVYGKSSGGINQENFIWDQIANCFCFLSIFYIPTQAMDRVEKLNLSSLVQEISVASTLCKPIVIAIQHPMEKKDLGVFSQNGYQKITFEMDHEDGDWVDRLRQDIFNALERAPRSQMKQLDERRKAMRKYFD